MLLILQKYFIVQNYRLMILTSNNIWFIDSDLQSRDGDSSLRLRLKCHKSLKQRLEIWDLGKMFILLFVLGH